MQEKEKLDTDSTVENGEQAANMTAETIETGQPDTNEAPLSPEQQEIAQLKAQVDDAKAKYLYLAADFENYKRHAARERMEMSQQAGREIMAALIPILDDFERAQKNVGLDEGMVLIQQKLINTVKSKGLAKIELQKGDDFNADQQEAVAEIPAASDDLKGKIVEVLEQGYQLGDRIIRFAKVVVGR